MSRRAKAWLGIDARGWQLLAYLTLATIAGCLLVTG